MHTHRWHIATILVGMGAVAFVLAVALISALVMDPVSVAGAIGRGDVAQLARAFLDVLGAAARALLRWL
jgi:hypothetical protein